jgi:hypothetical protein
MTSKEVLKKVCKTCKVEFGGESEGRAESAPQRGFGGRAPDEWCSGTLPREGSGGASSPFRAGEKRSRQVLP